MRTTSMKNNIDTLASISNEVNQLGESIYAHIKEDDSIPSTKILDIEQSIVEAASSIRALQKSILSVC